MTTAASPRRVYVGMKHWHPYIAETMSEMARDGIERVTAVVLAPHYSRMSVGGYRKSVEAARDELGGAMEISFVERWYEREEFITMMAKLVRDGLARFDASEREDVCVVFSAHSLPQRIREWDDPYERELLASSELVAKRVGLADWRFAWQSAGATGEPWIGPDILDYLETLHAEGVRNVLMVPIGFVCDHLEILWDIDHEAREKAAELGMTLERTALPNCSDAFIDVLEAIVASEAAQ